MKMRCGFVSNSSSASFVLYNKYLTKGERKKILNYSDGDGWTIYEDGRYIRGHTIMDNGGFLEFLKELNIGMGAIKEWK
jgi:hypothetical protein